MKQRARPSSLPVVGGLVALKLAAHLVVIQRYGWHGDELYFVECGRHLAWGYVDHPPLIGWIARATEALGGGLFLLRLPAVLAGVATMIFVALLVREWRGGRLAQLLALSACLFAPAYLRMAAMLTIPVFEVLLAAGASYFIVRALARSSAWPWLAAGFFVGVGLLTKHSMAIWTVCLVVGLLASEHRRVLATRWPWLGFALALVIFLPNAVWQIHHDFATLEFAGALRREILAEQGRTLFVAGQFLYFHPLAAPLWIAGLLSRERTARPFAWLFVALFLVLFVGGGKPYYLGVAYPALFAAGAVAFERGFARHRKTIIAYAVAFALTGSSFALITLPALPLPTVDAVLGRMFGWIVPPMALTHDLHGMFGWDAHVSVAQRVHASLPPDDRARALVLTGTYAQAAAVNVLGDGSVPAASGHMSYFLWGPPAHRGDVLIAYGVQREFLERHYARVEPVDRILAPLARPFDSDKVVFLCRDPRAPIASFWRETKRYAHGKARLSWAAPPASAVVGLRVGPR